MTKVAIIGAGAAGLTAVIDTRKKGVEIHLFDKNKKVGKKLSVTGNGRCNYWNENQELKNYHTNSNTSLETFITLSDEKEVEYFFQKLGVIPRIKNGYYYPYSNQAESIRRILEEKVKSENAILHMEEEVEKVDPKDQGFIITTSKEKYYFDYCIIATGSIASLKEKENKGLIWAQKLNHKVIDITPSLVQVKVDFPYLKDWQGVRSEVEVSLLEDNIKIKKEHGEIQLTKDGVSGICIFNLSRDIARGLKKKKEEIISINFLPFVDNTTWLEERMKLLPEEKVEYFLESIIPNKLILVLLKYTQINKDKKVKELSKEEIISINFLPFVDNTTWLEERMKLLAEEKVEYFLESIIPNKLILVLLKYAQINKDKKVKELSKEEISKLKKTLTSLNVKATETLDTTKAQVCSGGVSLEDLKENMESKKINHLYFIGEVVDVDGDCGGYNLGFAWRSGLRAGKSIRSEVSD